ncbi:U4/U6-U5 snRNP complex subunit prp31 [Taxawa tesnikishii (nom. ined.)]|nr:U4/U6-U5 snRNP complex subunit prp31 [Dothideales sp. JES 119]
MATIADELLNDFEDTGSEGEEENAGGSVQDDGIVGGPSARGLRRPSDPAAEVGDMELDGDEEEVEDVDMDGDAAANGAAEHAEDAEETKARYSRPDFGLVLQKIAHYQNLPPEKQTRNVGSIEDNPEYRLLTQSNTLSTSIDAEIILVHKFIRDHYSVRFPELETFIGNPLDYAKAVAIIGNGPMENIKSISTSTDNMVGQSLKQVLDGPTLMVVTVEATTTRGQPLSDAELATVRKACEMVLRLDKAKITLTEYVQSRMNMFAPNLTTLIGSLTAAQLINFAGGITGLAKTPSCNIPPLGSKKSTQTGFATNVGVRHQGYLYNSPLIKEIPTDLKKQAMRIASAKIVLAARVDRVHESPDGSTGETLKQQCLDRLDKLVEPPPNRGARALPAPDDKPARKRGGRRARKAKEATAMTDLRKAQNRMAFGKEEAEVGYGTGDGTKGLGMIGQADGGRVRAQQIDQRTRAKLSKKNPGWGGATPLINPPVSRPRSAVASVDRRAMQPTTGVGGAGTSSVAFTPVQGLELVDPKVREEMNRKRKAEEDRWFRGGTFTQVGSAGGAGGSGGANGGFKVPALPAKKKVDTGATRGA